MQWIRFPSLFSFIFTAFYLFFSIPFTANAASGPSVQQLEQTLQSTWRALETATHCDSATTRKTRCLQDYHGKTIQTRLFGQTINALIIFENGTSDTLSGPVTLQQSGFLIGPFDGFGYKIVREQTSRKVNGRYRISDNGAQISAHKISGNHIEAPGIKLNNGVHWLDGKQGPWIYHWSALSKARLALKQVRQSLQQ